MSATDAPKPPVNTRTVIIGAGMSGVLMGIRLKEAGLHNFTILEKGGDIGGTWRENRYPGLTCDVPSQLYTYSFALNPNWTERYPSGPEIQKYFLEIVDRYDLRRHIRCHSEVTEAKFENHRWQLQCSDGHEEVADFVVAATGGLHHPRYPKITGLDEFAGECFHTARWPDSVDLRGKRVGLIGTGSTGVQLLPELARDASHVSVFQRTPPWIFPSANTPFSPSEQTRFRDHPSLMKWQRKLYAALYENGANALLRDGVGRRGLHWICRRHLNSVSDAQLKAKLTPDYEPACKRLVISSLFYPAVQRPNVQLETDAIDHVTKSTVVTRSGTKHPVDVIVLATGFQAHAFMRPTALTGDGGMTLNQLWEKRPSAYRTVALPHFPNFFMVVGPHSPFGNFSIIDIAEEQTKYALAGIQRHAAGELRSLAPKADATERYNEDLSRSFDGTIWTTGCSSWYLDARGIPVLWPYTLAEFHRQMRNPDWNEYNIST